MKLKNFIKISICIVLIFLSYFWFVGINLDYTKYNISDFMLTNNDMLIIIYDKNGGKAWVQSIDKYGIQKTLCAKYNRAYIYPTKEYKYINHLGDISSLKVNLVKPWYYAKTKFLFDKNKDVLGYNASVISEGGSLYYGYMFRDNTVSELPLSTDSHLSFVYADCFLWDHIGRKSGVYNFIDKESLFPTRYVEKYERVYHSHDELIFRDELSYTN